MSIKSEIDRISGNVDDALAATAEMGAEVPATANSNNLGTLIRSIPKVNVVQTTGDSTTDVMSQAAVTNALDSYLPKSGGTVSGTVTFSNSSTQPGQPGLKWKAVNSKTPYVGYCTGSTDATFMVGSLAGTTYQTGLAIGGSSGNLLWKGAKIATTNDIPAAYSHPSTHPASMITGLATVATSGSYNDLTNKPTIPAAVTVDSALSSSSTNPVQNKVVNSALAGKAPSYTYGTTDLTAGTSALTTGVLYFVYE